MLNVYLFNRLYVESLTSFVRGAAHFVRSGRRIARLNVLPNARSACLTVFPIKWNINDQTH